MKAYGLKGKIRHGGKKVANHTRKGDSCSICQNFKVVKKSARQQARRSISEAA